MCERGGRGGREGGEGGEALTPHPTLRTLKVHAVREVEARKTLRKALDIP